MSHRLIATPILTITLLVNHHASVSDYPVGSSAPLASEAILRAALSDWKHRCRALAGARVFVEGLQSSATGRIVPQPPDMLAAIAQRRSGLVIAADAPTVPLGYLQSAIDAVRGGRCARVYGPALAGGWYLLGWGSGTGTVALPSWYRMTEPGGLERARNDMFRGCVGPAVKAMLVAAEYRANSRGKSRVSGLESRVVDLKG